MQGFTSRLRENLPNGGGKWDVGLVLLVLVWLASVSMGVQPFLAYVTRTYEETMLRRYPVKFGLYLVKFVLRYSQRLAYLVSEPVHSLIHLNPSTCLLGLPRGMALLRP